jgi:hypothetical protein
MYGSAAIKAFFTINWLQSRCSLPCWMVVAQVQPADNTVIAVPWVSVAAVRVSWLKEASR